MNKFLDVLKAVGLYLWQLPQNLVGLLVMLVTNAKQFKSPEKGVSAYTYKIKAGSAMGKYVFIYEHLDRCTMNDRLYTFDHEVGHTKQSKYLGWLWIPVIGLPSLVHNIICHITGNWDNYYKFYTEAWANKLGNVPLS